MATKTRSRKSGQALVMVTLALVAMFGMMGLAVDLGWAFYVRKSARAASEAAALAAIKAAMNAAGGDWTCAGGKVTCSATPIPCPAAGGNLQSACIYAAQNGFPAGGPRTITVQASDAVTPPTVSGCTPVVSHPPTAPCVDTPYWVTVRISQTVPQLFSAVLGHMTGTVSARATGAVAKAESIGSLILLNRENDPAPPIEGVDLDGTNLYLGGNPKVTVPGGVLLASGSNRNPNSAGEIQGGGWVKSPFTYVRTPGWVEPTVQDFTEPWNTMVRNRLDMEYFWDPMRDKGGQPPVNPTGNFIAVPQGGGGRYTLTSAICGGTCPPANYYAVNNGVATGDQIEITGNVTFDGAGFGDYVFFGGLNVRQGANVDLGPGRYVFAGVKTPSQPNEVPIVLNLDNRAFVQGGTGEGLDPGRILILTDSSYAGKLDATVAAFPVSRAWGGPGNTLGFGKTSIKSGNNDASHVELYGLKLDDPLVQAAGLNDFAPVVIWQDQRNSLVNYTDIGQVDVSCGSLNNPCYNDPRSPDATPPPSVPPDCSTMGTGCDGTVLELWSSQFAKYGGVIYQPRGAATQIQASDDYEGALRIISGAMKIQGSSRLTLTSLSTPTWNWLPALVE